MADDRIDAIRQRLEAATPGPWRYRTTSEPAEHWVRGEASEVALVGGYFDLSEADELALPVPHDSEPDAELIANAPADIEFLLGEVSRLQGELAMAREQTDEIAEDFAFGQIGLSEEERWMRPEEVSHG